VIGGLCPKIQSILITTVCVPTYSLYTTRRSVSQHTVYIHHNGLCPTIQSTHITTVCVPPYSLYTSRRSVSQHTVYIQHDGLCPNIQSIHITTVCVPTYSPYTSRRSVSFERWVFTKWLNANAHPICTNHDPILRYTQNDTNRCTQA